VGGPHNRGGRESYFCEDEVSAANMTTAMVGYYSQEKKRLQYGRRRTQDVCEGTDKKSWGRAPDSQRKLLYSERRERLKMLGRRSALGGGNCGETSVRHSGGISPSE